MGVGTNEQTERNVSVRTARRRNVLPSFKVLLLCQGNCTLTKLVLFQTFVIHLFTSAECVVKFFLPSLFVGIYSVHQHHHD